MSEIRLVSRHAATILVGQLAVMAFGVADTVIAGRYSDAALAALSVGSALYISVYVGLIGIVQALLPIWAEMLGARRHEAVGRSLRQSLYLCGFICIAGMAALLFPGVLLRWAQVPDLMQDEVQRYLAVLAFAFAPSLLFRLYSTFNQSLGKPRLVTWLQIAALGLKIPLVDLAGGRRRRYRCHGRRRLRLGHAGRSTTSCCCWPWSCCEPRVFTSHTPSGGGWSGPTGRNSRTFARLGIPGGLAYLVEVTSFTLMALFIARLGTIASASHQIAASVAAVLYMMPLSMAVACSARVSFWLGAGRPDHAKRVVFMGLKLTALIALALAAIVSIAGPLLAGWYSAAPRSLRWPRPCWCGWPSTMWPMRMQALCAFLLRCYRITMAPLALYGVLLWGLGLFGGYQLAYVGPCRADAATRRPAASGPPARWPFALVAACLLGLLLYAVRRSSQPARQTALRPPEPAGVPGQRER